MIITNQLWYGICSGGILMLLIIWSHSNRFTLKIFKKKRKINYRIQIDTRSDISNIPPKIYNVYIVQRWVKPYVFKKGYWMNLTGWKSCKNAEKALKKLPMFEEI